MAKAFPRSPGDRVVGIPGKKFQQIVNRVYARNQKFMESLKKV